MIRGAARRSSTKGRGERFRSPYMSHPPEGRVAQLTPQRAAGGLHERIGRQRLCPCAAEVLRPLQRHRQGADILQVIYVVIYGGQNVRHRPLHYLCIQIRNLGPDIVRQVTGILIVDSTHDDFEFIYGLLIDDITLGLAPVIDSFADEELDAFDILG